MTKAVKQPMCRRTEIMTNSIAKVFIVINFVLSAIYLAVTGMFLSQKWDYRQMYLEQSYQSEIKNKALDDSLKETQKRLELITQTATEARKKNSKIAEENNKLIQENANLQAKNKQHELNYTNISTQISEIRSALTAKDNQIAELQQKEEKYKQEVDLAKKAKDEADNEQQRLQILKDNLEGELAEHKRLLQISEKELREAKLVIRAVQNSGVKIDTIGSTVKPLDGEVVAVSDDVPILMLSIGSDQGVEKGYQFTVYRGNKFVGRVIVEEVYKEMSEAKIIRDMTVEKPKKGDKVTTRISGGGL